MIMMDQIGDFCNPTYVRLINYTNCATVFDQVPPTLFSHNYVTKKTENGVLVRNGYTTSISIFCDMSFATLNVTHVLYVLWIGVGGVSFRNE